MPPELNIVSGSDAKESVVRSLIKTSHAPSETVLFEVVRTATWALRTGAEPIHVLRLTNRLTELVVGIGLDPRSDEAEVRQNIRQILDRLSDAGDLVEFPGGLWAPATTRIVDLGGLAGHLLIGGMPTNLLASGTVQIQGPFRRLLRADAVRQLGLPVETLNEWVRLPGDDLGEWANRIVAVQLPTYNEPTGGSSIEIYDAARARPGAPQVKRWIAPVADSTGRFLARRKRAFGAREYRVVEVVNGHIARSGSVLGSGEWRRLMYAFDAKAKNPVLAQLRESGTTTEVLLKNELPVPEHRLFSALGLLARNPDRPYECRWTFERDVQMVQQRLEALGIQIVLASTGRSHS